MNTTTPEAFIPLNGSAGNSAPVTGGKRHKLKVVTRKQARKLLKSMGKRMRGGEGTEPAAIVTTPATTTTTEENKGGRRTKKGNKKPKSRKLFGLRY